MGRGRRGTSEIHHAGIRFQQRIHFAALLIVFLAGSAFAGGIEFNPEITEREFREFSEVVGQAIYATPVLPAEGQSLLGFEVGVAVTAVEVSDKAAYYLNSIDGDITSGGYLLFPRIVVTKGFGGWTIHGSYAATPDSDLEVLGAALDLPIIDGGLTAPTIAVRATWSEVGGEDDFDMTAWGVEGFISKAFGPVTPYAGFGIVRTESNGRIDATILTDEIVLSENFENERITAGVRLSLVVLDIVVEASESSERSYTARVSLGF